MSVSLSSVVQPTTASGFLTFAAVVADGDVDALSIQTGSNPTISAWDGTAFVGDYLSGGSSVTGAGSEGSPYLFSVRPLGGWPTSITGALLRISLYFTEAPVTLPASFQDETYYRHYAAHAGNALLTNLATPTVIATGPFAGLTMRTGPYANVVMHGLTQDFVTFLPYLQTMFTLAAALDPPMKVIPGARIWPSATATFDDCIVNTAYVATMTAGFSLLGDMALAAGHNHICMDTEQYSAHATLSNSEPNNVWLATKGVTEAQFRAAWQPLVDMILEKGLAVSAGQFARSFDVDNTRDNLQSLPLFLLESLGPDRFECMTEIPTFEIAENWRKDPNGAYRGTLQSQMQAQAQAERLVGLGKLHFRPFVFDDELQTWGATWPASSGAFGLTGRSKAILYDWTRTNYASRGTAAHYNGTAFVGGTPNDCEYVVPFSPTANGVAEAFSVGMATTPIDLQIWAGTNGGAASLLPSALAAVDPHGYTLSAPPAPNDFVFLRMADVLPNSASSPFSIDIDGFMIPSGIATDIVIACIGQGNVLVCQIVYLLASDKIQVQWGSSGATTLDLLAAPAKDTVHRIQLVRDNATQYRVGINAVAMQTVATPATSIFRAIQLGAGRNPSSPSTATNWGAPGISYRGTISGVVGATTSYLVGQLSISARAWDATDITNVRAGHYPWGYGT